MNVQLQLKKYSPTDWNNPTDKTSSW